MPSLATAQHIEVTEDTLGVELADGRTASVPLTWYPRLLHGSPEERNNWRLIGNGEGIHWPDLDEDISVENILLWQPSQESQASFKRWLQARTKQPSAGQSRRFFNCSTHIGVSRSAEVVSRSRQVGETQPFSSAKQQHNHHPRKIR